MLKIEKIHLYDKILSPVVTEKSTNLSEQNKIVFKVPFKSNKKILKKNIEKIFKILINFYFNYCPKFLFCIFIIQ